MPRLVPTTGCPTIDAELATYADVVLRATDDELILLRYSPRFRCWYVCGCQSVSAATEEVVPEAELYWQRIGYLETASHAYAIFPRKPVRAPEEWNTFYDRLATTDSLRTLRR